MSTEIAVASYGGGVNSVAALVWMHKNGIVPKAIVMADPGSERRGTVSFRDEILPAWLDSVGFPRVTVIDRITEGQFVKRAWRLEKLIDECLRLKSLPSVAYGWKKCSAKYKGDTQRWWIARQPWAQEEWKAGRKIKKVIGYDFDEERRVLKKFQNEWENERLVPWYPLFDAKLTRDDCEALIADAGLPVPPKSACYFCPNSSLEEWQELRTDDPEAFARSVEMSRRSVETIESPDVVGLMRCNPHGQRQLHVWADGGYPDIAQDKQTENEQPCECAL